jgi:hypothetical protein
MRDLDRLTDEDADLLRAVTEWNHPSAWRRSARGKALVALTLAALLPSPPGYWSPLTLILWGLIGDPRSFLEATASVAGGAALLAAYAAVIFGGLTALQWAASRAMQHMAESNRRAISKLCREDK